MEGKNTQITTGFTAAKLSYLFGSNVQTWKRWARTYLGIDKDAGRGQGAVRKFTPDESFLLWLSGRLTSMSGLSSVEVRDVFKHLKPWLKKRGYFPIERGWKERVRLKVSKLEYVETWSFSITRGTDKSILLRAKGNVEDAKWKTMNDLPAEENGITIITETYAIEVINKAQDSFIPAVTIKLDVDDLVTEFCNKIGV